MKTAPSHTPSIRSSLVFQLPVTLLSFVAALTISPSAFAQVNGNWNTDTASTWSTGTNWSSTPTVPGGVGSVVNLTFDITGNRAVTIDTTSRTVGTLTIGDTAPIYSYYLNASGGAKLVMDNGGAGAVINYLGAGFDEINAPIFLNDNLTVNASASGAFIRIKGGITGTGNVTFNAGSGPNSAGASTTTGGITGINHTGTITNSGSGAGITALLAIGSNVTDVIQNSAGSLYLNGINAYTGSTIINSGQLRLNGAGSILSSSPLVLGGGTLNSLQTAGSTQAFASTTVNRGFSTVTNGTATNIVALGAITRSTGGLLNISSLVGTTTTANTTDSSGILGTWITTGTGTSLRYATGGAGGAITAYTSTAAAANLSDVTSATTNYSFAANATQTGNITGNTLQYIGSAAAAWNTGNFGVTLNGLMNGGNANLTQTGTGIITIGSNKELVILSNNNRAISLASAIADNGGGASALTYGGPGAGLLTLAGTNTYSGNTSIHSGAFTLADAGTLTFYIGANGVSNKVAGTSTGAVTFAGSFAFDLSGANLTAGNSWTIVDRGSLTGTSFTATFDVQGFTDIDGDDIWTNGAWSFAEASGILSYAAIPEPSTYAVFAGAGMLIFAGVRRTVRTARVI